MSWREIETRYRGSILGVLWSFLTPLFMLVVFTFVFAVVFRSRWPSTEGTTIEFALILFAGLTTFNLFAEVLGRAPSLIVGQPNLVKKVVFPLEILPVIALLSALFQALIALVILLFFQTIVGNGLHWTVLALPFLVLPLCIFTLGMAWFLAALGVFVRDVGQVVPTIVTAILFLSPIFYPSSNLPEWLRPISADGPLGFSIEAVRNAVIFGTLPDLTLWLLGLAGSLIVALLGFSFFQKTRKGFSDVL
jgi:lipopolysaccharide transport system permease protein